jgi:hypothetical protein
MTGTTILLRQIHPSFIQAGRATSQAFCPTPKDEGFLSAYDGDQIQPQPSWAHYTTTLLLKSDGVMGVSHAEFTGVGLTPKDDPLPNHPHHVTIDFNAFALAEQKRKGKKLKVYAEARGWLYKV